MASSKEGMKNVEASLGHHFSPLEYSNLTGKRNRSDDSDTESVGSNSELPSTEMDRERPNIGSSLVYHSNFQSSSLVCPSNSQSLYHGNNFLSSNVGTIETRMVPGIFQEDVKHYSVEDQAILYAHCGPSSSTYSSLLLENATKRRELLHGILVQWKSNGPPINHSYTRIHVPM